MITEKTISVEEKATNMEDMLKEEEKGVKVRFALHFPRTTAAFKRVKWLLLGSEDCEVLTYRALFLRAAPHYAP